MCYSGIFCKEKLDANHLRFKGFINCQLNAIHDRLDEISTVRTRRIEFQISVERRLHELSSFRRRPSRELKKKIQRKKKKCFVQPTPESARCANINFFFYPLIFMSGATDFAERMACSLLRLEVLGWKLLPT